MNTMLFVIQLIVILTVVLIWLMIMITILTTFSHWLFVEKGYKRTFEKRNANAQPSTDADKNTKK